MVSTMANWAAVLVVEPSTPLKVSPVATIGVADMSLIERAVPLVVYWLPDSVSVPV